MHFRIAKSIVTVILAVNVLFVLGMFLTGFSYLVDPAKFRYAAAMGMFFPFFAAANLAFLVFWVITKPVCALLPFISLVLSYTPVRMYASFHRGGDVPSGALKIMTYNVLGFHGMEGRELDRKDNPIVYYLTDSDADVICLQECTEKDLSKEMFALLEEKYPYHHFSNQGKGMTSLAVYTKYPIIKVDSIPCDTCSNISVAYTISFPQGYGVVVNNHFESNKFEPEKKKDFRRVIVGDLKKDSARAEGRYLLSRFTEMAVKRSAQTKAVAGYLEINRDVPVILCGDFNDTPISHNHHVIARLLKDCFREKGFGFGWTYTHDGMRVRIDNIMCSDHFEPYACKVMSDVKYSDHYPVVCWLGFKETRLPVKGPEDGAPE